MSTEQKSSTPDSTQDSASWGNPWGTPRESQRKELQRRLLESYSWLESALAVAVESGEVEAVAEINVVLAALDHIWQVPRTRKHRGESLEMVDATRVKVIRNWRSEKDGPRYVIMDDDGRTGKLYDSNELVTMFVKRP